MRRRQFLALLGSMAIGCPADVAAQQSDRVRRIGVLMPLTAGDALALRRAKIFRQALQDLGWTDGQNRPVATSSRYNHSRRSWSARGRMCSSVSGQRQRQHCSKRPGQSPSSSVDPVAQGIVESLARPGGNATGFFATEPSLGGKWLELL
jgi:putative ABC transport system substrate-binding protein